MYFKDIDRSKVKPSEMWLLDFLDKTNKVKNANDKGVLELELVADIVADLINYKIELDSNKSD